MLATGLDCLHDVWQRRGALAAFTTYTLESTRGICEAAEETGLPVIVQAGSSSFQGVGRVLLASSALAMSRSCAVPVGVHLDHSVDIEEIRACIELGYSSIMFDGSKLAFEDNVAQTKQIVEECHNVGVWVEAELGSIPGDENASTGVESGDLTTPTSAAEFAERTGVDALAVAIGSIHGYSALPVHLDFDVLEQIRSAVPIPLVLHGASGLDEHELKRAVRGGMAKVNFNAELRRSYLDAITKGLDHGGDDIVRLQLAAVSAVREIARAKMTLIAGKQPKN